MVGGIPFLCNFFNANPLDVGPQTTALSERCASSRPGRVALGPAAPGRCTDLRVRRASSGDGGRSERHGEGAGDWEPAIWVHLDGLTNGAPKKQGLIWADEVSTWC